MSDGPESSKTRSLVSDIREVRDVLHWCGYRARTDVVLRASESSRHLGGMYHCNRVLCPTCGPFAASRRMEALTDVAAQIPEATRSYHVVLTCRHHLGVKWKAIASAVLEAWKYVRTQKWWRRSVLGFVRAGESTYGKNGHHYHAHTILTLVPGTDPEAFKRLLEAGWTKGLARSDRTWDPTSQRSRDGKRGWFSEIAREGTGSTIAYLAAKVLRTEVGTSGGKHGARLWDLPVIPYVEVWKQSKRHRWFATGGCWKIAKELDDDEELDEEREKVGVQIGAVLPRSDWEALPFEPRQWIAGLVANSELDEATIAREWDLFCRAAREWAAEKAKAKGPAP